MKYAQPLKICTLIMFIALTAFIQGCATKAPVAAPEQQGKTVQLTKIESHEVEGKTEIAIEGTEPILQYTSFQLTDPLRLIIDISEANIGQVQNKIDVNNGTIIDITPSQKDTIARLEIALAQTVDAKVNQVGGKLIVEIAKPVEVAKTSPEPVVSETTYTSSKVDENKPEATATAQLEKATATVVSAVQASAGKDGVKVIISADGTMIPNSFMVEGKKLVVDIPGVRSMVKPSVIPVRKGGLDRVRVGQHQAPDQKVRVVLDLTKPLAYSITPDGNSLVIAMHSAASALNAKMKTEVPSSVEANTEDKLPQERAAQAPDQTAVAEKEITQPKESAAVTPPQDRNEHIVEPSKQELRTPETALLAGGSKYTGKKISLDLQDADLVNVMRLFADVANLNIILAPDVKGKVTVRMVNIPWDQAMDIILKMNGLGYALEDNVLRIAAVSALTKEAEDEIRSKEAKKKAEDLNTRIIPINYSTAATIEGTIKKSLSPRGETVTDTRTNTLIVKDIQRNIDEIVSLVKLLDKPIPQVMIEARIVEASLNFNRTIGVQWGGQYKADAAHGNATGSAFPSAIGITGGPTMGATASGTGNYFVNMPAAAGAGTGGGAMGFTFGSIGKSLNLDLVLSALESTGEGKVISTPRVSALDNKEAKIEQGISIPFSTTSAQGTQIQFVDAKLSLTVTPHATPDNKIFMKIQATKNAPDTSLLGASGQPSIRKNEATTEILLADGETAVIGGILIIDRGQTIDKIPFLGDIPFIGWLFKRKSTREEKRELIIFITPKIIRQEVI